MSFVVAHRGSSGSSTDGGRRNTLDAFRRAAAIGAAWVELDVRPTADGALAVHHDPLLDDGRAVAEVRAADLPTWLPMLDTALDACAGMGVIVEVKAGPSDPRPGPVAAAVADLLADRLARVPDQQLLVSSFNPAVLGMVGSAEPVVERALLCIPPFDALAAIELAASLGCAAVHPYGSQVTAEVVAAAHAEGLRVDTWTVNSPDHVRRVAALGVGGIMTDDVPMALAALAAMHP